MPVDDALLEAEDQMQKAIDHLHHELRTIRTGRASPSLVEYVKIDYYGSPTDLKNIAAIQVPEATQLLIKPFSPGDLKLIEKGLNDSKLGLTTQSDGKSLRINLPPMSMDRRKQLAGQCKGYGEDAKIRIRNARRDANKMLENDKKDSTITEDDEKAGKEEINELTKKMETAVDDYVEKKQKEIMDV